MKLLFDGRIYHQCVVKAQGARMTVDYAHYEYGTVYPDNGVYWEDAKMGVCLNCGAPLPMKVEISIKEIS